MAVMISVVTMKRRTRRRGDHVNRMVVVFVAGIVVHAAIQYITTIVSFRKGMCMISSMKVSKKIFM